ncbi:MAG: FtsH protease activity modulator HflK [Rhodanobacteraceae bacterium]|nr:FtsH protease activity modulator HflK [Rhodanobacteraceae bacterium]MBL0042351.1 FtsH protease activity modulator HflK [Xanthomonadales bacterium]
MAWNEPGNNKKPRDPWQDGENRDLDAALKQIKDRFGRFFGGGGGVGFPGPLLIVLGVLGAWFAVDSWQTIDERERGVVLRFGKFERVMGSGLNMKWPRPIETVEIVETTRVRSDSAEVRMLTKDEALVMVDFNVQYTASDPYLFLYGGRAPEDTLRQTTESAIRQVIGASTLDDVFSEKRTGLANTAKEELQKTLERYSTGIIVTELNFQNLRPPAEVKEAFDDAIAAREDNQRIKNEAEAYAQKIVPEARGLAERNKSLAEGERQSAIAKATGESARFSLLVAQYQKAPQVTRKRLFLETMQDVLSRNPKVMVDAGGGNNVMVLPLDKLMQNVVLPVLPALREDGAGAAVTATARAVAPEREAFDPARVAREPRQ